MHRSTGAGRPMAARPASCRRPTVAPAPGRRQVRKSNGLKSNKRRRQWCAAAVAARVGAMVDNERTGRERYEGLGSHDLRRSNGAPVVAAVDGKRPRRCWAH